jgi:hypothetical protein
MMEAGLKEKLKTGVLAALILTSLLQVGIHWNLQVQGHPFRFLSILFQAGTDDSVVDEKLLSAKKIGYVLPNRIVVSDEQSARWVLDTSGDTWRTAWDDFKIHYLPLLVSEKPDKQLQRSSWDQLLASRRTFLFEFEHPVPAELLAWLTGTSSGKKGISFASALEDIEKIAVVPSENVNTNINTLYVLSTQGVYRFMISLPTDALPKNWYVMDQKELSVPENHLYSLMGETLFVPSARQDLLVSTDESDMVQLPTYEAGLPEAIGATFELDNLQSIQESLLLNRKDSLLTRLDESTGEVTFSDTENTFRLDTSGNFFYRYLPGAGTEGTDMESAFRQAMAFLEDRRWLIGDAGLILDGVKAFTPGTANPSGKMTAYTFTFVYRVDGCTVLAKDATTGKAVAPVTITAISDRVIECGWCIRKVTPVASSSWNVFFVDFYTEAIKEFPILQEKGQELSIIRNGYVIPEREAGAQLYPQWIMQANDAIYTLPMRKAVP